MSLRADFARTGWSLEADLGTRLRYADALAIYEAFAHDPTAYTGARLAGFKFPMSAADMVLLSLAGATSLLGTDTTPPETARPAADEIHKAEQAMSSLFT